jgi:hypothetical protein
MRLCVLSCCYEHPELAAILRESCEMFDLPLVMCEASELGGRWNGDMRLAKLVAPMRKIEELKDQYDLFCWSDGFDTFVQATEAEIITQWSIMGKPPMLLSAEKNCFPDPGRAALYPPCESPWRFTNAGNWMGEGEFLIEAIKGALNHSFPNEIDDQRIWTEEYAIRKTPGIALDTERRIFQNMWGTTEDERRQHSSFVIHYSGGIWRNSIDLRLIDAWKEVKVRCSASLRSYLRRYKNSHNST